MPVGGVPKHLVKTLTRAKFEALAHNLIQACLEPCKKAMSDAGLGNSDIDEVILVGCLLYTSAGRYSCRAGCRLVPYNLKLSLWDKNRALFFFLYNRSDEFLRLFH